MSVERIQPSVAALDMVCVEAPAPPTAMIVFGASGDLVHRKLLPSLAQIQQRGLLSEHFCLLGCARTEYSDEQFRQKARQAIEQSAEGASADAIRAITEKMYYVHGDYADPATYERIRQRATELRARQGIRGCRLFFLAVPPVLYAPIVERPR